MFTKLSPSLSIPIFYTCATLLYLFRFLFGNIYGIFITCLVAYYYSESLLGISPLSYDGLMQWIVSQSESTKVAIFSSVITVVGFLIAFATATSNWKSQILANLKVQASDELEIFFSECSKLATDCKLYATSLRDAVEKINNECPNQEAEFLAQYNRDKGQLFLKQRDRLISLCIESNYLKGKYSSLLISVPRFKAELDSATTALEKILDKLYFMVPYHIPSDINPVQSFLNQVNITKCIELIKAVDENYLEISFSSGSIRGKLLSTIFGFNFWSLFFLYKERKLFKNTIIERYNNLQKKVK